jgi:uncharacterized protein (UPF0335 family)
MAWNIANLSLLSNTTDNSVLVQALRQLALEVERLQNEIDSLKRSVK